MFLFSLALSRRDFGDRSRFCCGDGGGGIFELEIGGKVYTAAYSMKIFRQFPQSDEDCISSSSLPSQPSLS
jgi:hypothetical protein